MFRHSDATTDSYRGVVLYWVTGLKQGSYGNIKRKSNYMCSTHPKRHESNLGNQLTAIKSNFVQNHQPRTGSPGQLLRLSKQKSKNVSFSQVRSWFSLGFSLIFPQATRIRRQKIPSPPSSAEGCRCLCTRWLAGAKRSCRVRGRDSVENGKLQAISVCLMGCTSRFWGIRFSDSFFGRPTFHDPMMSRGEFCLMGSLWWLTWQWTHERF